jgi:hypothetical protein
VDSVNRGYDEVVISKHGGLDPIRLPVAAPQASWEISGAGAFSAFARVDDVRSVGLWTDIKGRWLSYASAAGDWGGVITAQPTTDNVVEIVAEGYLALLRGRHVEVSGTQTGCPGGLARRVLIESGLSAPTFIRLGSIGEADQSISVELVGDAGSDLLPRISDAGDAEWIIDADRVFTFSRRLGQDRSQTIRLVEDRHIVAHRVNDDVWTNTATASAVLAVPEGTAPPPWSGVPVGIGANSPAVPGDRTHPLPTTATELTLANIDDAFLSFALGDTVYVELGSIGVHGRFRANVRALEVTSQTLTVSGELLKDGLG